MGIIRYGSNRKLELLAKFTPEEGAWSSGAQSGHAESLSPTYQVGTELREHHTGGSHPEWTEQLVDHAMDVMQREDMKDHVVFSPRPLVDQPRHLKDNSTASGRREGTMQGEERRGGFPS